MAAPKEDALTKTYDLMLWLFPQIGKFPREYRFVLGDRLQNDLLDQDPSPQRGAALG